MPISTTEVLAAERTAADLAHRTVAGVPLSGADLVRECASALRAYLRTRPGLKLSEGERQDLVQTLCADALTAHRKQHGRVPLTRGSVGRSYLLACAAGHLRQGREWRDTLDGYRTRAERERDLAPLVAGNVESVSEGEGESGDDAPAADVRGGWLAVALARERMRAGEDALPVLPADLPALADALAAALSDALEASGKDRERIAVAVRSACGQSLASQAAEDGSPSLRTLATRAGEGAALIRAGFTARELATLTRAVADVESAERALMRRLRTSLDPATADLALAACAAVDAARVTLRNVPRGPLPGARRMVLNARPPVRPLYGCATASLPLSRPTWQRAPRVSKRPVVTLSAARTEDRGTGTDWRAESVSYWQARATGYARSMPGSGYLSAARRNLRAARAR